MPRSTPQQLPKILYTDNDRFCRNWLENLVRAGELPDGDMWCWDIERMEVIDASVYDQVHWFAGIGGWPLALKLAGWPAHRRVWTGSCPCQPFSNAGKRKGTDDERHLWPEWLRFIAQHRPPTIFGEQVASNLGRQWLAGVRVDLEALGYAVGAADLCAAGVGAPHIRQRLFWVADAQQPGETSKAQKRVTTLHQEDITGGSTVREGSSWGTDAVKCPDSARRRCQPGTVLLVDGVSACVGRLRAYGNAIVPQIAAAFVRAFLETEKVT